VENEKTVCVLCAWRIACNKKFSMDGTTTTRCLEYTRDVTLPSPKEKDGTSDEKDET